MTLPLYLYLRGPFLSIVTYHRELVVPAPVGRNHQDNPADEGDEPQPGADESKEGNVVEHRCYNGDGTEENDGLHRVEAHKAILPLQHP